MSRPCLMAGVLASTLLLSVTARAQSHDHHDHHGHGAAPAAASDAPQMDHSQMDHSQMDHSQMDHSQMDHSQMDHSQMDHSQMDHSQMDHSQMTPASTQQPREPIPVLTDADRAAAFPPIDHAAMTHASPINSLLLVERLEHWDGQRSNGQNWEVTGWLGGDLNRVWLRSEGERSHGRTESADVELLYGRSISPWWDVLVGVRQDVLPGDGRSWAAVGIQGLAPYKFETSATLYIGSAGQVMAKAEVEYEILLSNRLILQPLVEATVAARDEPARGIGSGLNKVEAGLRLRYEFSRRFAPYVGISHERRFGDAADHIPGHARDTRWLAGVRMWF